MPVTKRAIEELESRIEDVQGDIDELQREMDAFELDPDDYADMYEEMLDEVHEGVFNLMPSQILKKCDPVAYRCGLNDFVDGIDLSEDDEYRDMEQRMSDLEDELSGLEDDLEELEEEREDQGDE